MYNKTRDSSNKKSQYYAKDLTAGEADLYLRTAEVATFRLLLTPVHMCITENTFILLVAESVPLFVSKIV